MTPDERLTRIEKALIAAGIPLDVAAPPARIEQTTTVISEPIAPGIARIQHIQQEIALLQQQESEFLRTNPVLRSGPFRPHINACQHRLRQAIAEAKQQRLIPADWSPDSPDSSNFAAS